MNCSYRSIWNDATGTFVAASENAATAGKKTSSCRNAAGGGASFAVQALSLAVMLAFGGQVFASPAGGVVTQGVASIGTAGTTTTIHQSTQNAVINWQSFNIAAAETVQFVQPNSSAVTLSRVLGSDPSSILGNLSANGKVFLVNPNGIVFGQGASVNVGGLVASTLDIADSDFMAGSYQFSGNSSAAVLNQGTINAGGGYVALLGANVSNDGVIAAKLGTVALAGGNAVTLDVAGDGLLNVTVNQGAVNALVQNAGLIQADGGKVLLTAQAAASLLHSAVNNTGVIQAQTLVTGQDGTIMLLGDMQNGTVSIGGTLDVSGLGAGQSGGSVIATGQRVGLFDGHINASGDAGGGTVLVGGDYQGKAVLVQNASSTYMSADATITADAITQGNGGTVVLWANESTRAYGSITARGGVQGGDGGLIETSGHWLDVAGIKVNASAANGQRGMWLLDPADVTIGSGTTNASLIAGVFTPDSGVNAATVDAGALRTALEAGGGTDVTITTTNSGAPGTGSGNITVASAITWVNTTGDSTLTLNAAGDVNINADISATRGSLVVCCGQDINVNARITTVSGSVLLSAGRDVNIVRNLSSPLAGITTTDGNIALCAARDVILNNAFDVAPLMTLTRGSVTAGQDLASLGVARGLTLNAGTAATGPGIAGGTVVFINGGLAGTYITTTGPAPVTPTNIFYNPSSYATPTDYSTFFTGNGGPLTQYMLVYPGVADKTFVAGDTTATLTGFKSTAISGPVPGTVTLVPGASPAANFESADPGTDKTVNFSGFTLAQGPIVTGGTGANFALPVSCCAPIVGKTTGNINAAQVVVPPVDVVVPPVDVVVPPADVIVPPVDVVEPPALLPLPPVRVPPALRPVMPILMPTVMPVVTPGATPPQLLSLLTTEAPPAPELPSVETAPAPVVVPPAIVTTPVPTPPPPVRYVTPPRPPKQGRN